VAVEYRDAERARDAVEAFALEPGISRREAERAYRGGVDRPSLVRAARP
jgi:hypothetical protein